MSNSDSMLLAPWEEKQDGAFTVFSVGGDNHCRAIINAVAAHYHRLSGKAPVTEESLRELADKSITLITTGENMLGAKMLKSQQGRVVVTGDGRLGLLPKGARSKGSYLRASNVLDFFNGYCPDVAQKSVDDVRAHFPQLREITQERLEQLPQDRSETITFAAFGTWQLPGETPCYDTWILASEYDRENDIVDGGVLLCRPDSGFSEHGSQFGRHLTHAYTMGEVVGFEPISFGEALELCDLDHDEAVARIFPTGAALAA